VTCVTEGNIEYTLSLRSAHNQGTSGRDENLYILPILNVHPEKLMGKMVETIYRLNVVYHFYA